MRLGSGGRALLAAALLAAALPVRAGLFDDDEARARIDKLRGEVAELGREQAKRLDTLGNTLGSAQLDLANQIELLKAELARLRGQIEVQGYEAESAKKRQTDFYNDLDTRLRKLETAEAEAKGSAVAKLPEVDPAAETRDYEAALGLFKAAKYREALAAFQSFIATYPKSAVCAGAHYWAASAHLQMREFGRAAEMFGKLYKGWPADAKAPDAMLGQANALEQGGDKGDMRKVLEALVDRYPESSAAQAAKLRLKKK